jgi:hypothetical protein
MNHITYHTEGQRAFLLEDDGTTVCEIVAPGQNNPVPIAVELVSRFNGYTELVKALYSVRDVLAAVDGMSRNNMQTLIAEEIAGIDAALEKSGAA